MKYEDSLDTVLLIDDEPIHVEWLSDFFVFKKLKVVQARNLQDALIQLKQRRFRYVVVDLNVPYEHALRETIAKEGAEFLKYPGLMAAQAARTSGHNTYQVVVYSVHDSEEVQRYIEHIRCLYILKGRPKELKAHIEETFDKFPHGWHSIR